jgi:hypothetical protein
MFVLAQFVVGGNRRLTAANGDGMIYQWDTFPWQTRDYAGMPGATLAERIRSYATGYWQRRIAIEDDATGVAAGDAAADSPGNDLLLPARSLSCEARLIDLSSHYNVRLDGWLHPTVNDSAGDFTLSAFPAGQVTVLGTPFDARGVILTRRAEPLGRRLQGLWECCPVRVDGIRVQRRVGQLRVLQATCRGEEVNFWGEDVEPGTAVGSYIWHFADGTTHEEPILYDRDLRDWWMPGDERPVDLERGRVAWIGDTPRAAGVGARVRLYLTTYANPYPGLEVSHIDFVSKMTQAAPFLVAITVEP